MRLTPDPTEYTCPHCGAVPGRLCRSNGTDYLPYHQARRIFRDGFIAGHRQGTHDLADSIQVTASEVARTPALQHRPPVKKLSKPKKEKIA